MENSEKVEEALAVIREQKQNNEALCLASIQSILLKHQCRLIVPILRLIDGKVVPEIAVESI